MILRVGQPTAADLAAARRYGRILDREGISAPYHVSGAALLLKLAKGESGFNSNADSGKAHGRTQFTPSSRAEVLRKFGVDPWASVDAAYHGAELHLRGKVNGQKGLEGYNPGMASYPSYILGQKIGPVTRGMGAGRALGDGSGGAARHEAGSPSIPNLQSGVDLTSLLGQLSQGSGGPPVSLPAAPAHAARPVLPQGYQSPVSSAVPSQSQKPSLQDMLALVRAQGGDVSTPGAAGAQGGQEAAQSGGYSPREGKVRITGPNPGRVKAPVLDFLGQISAVRGGKPIVASDGTGHSYRTVNGNVSEHSVGMAVDTPARGAELIRLGQAALIAAGMPRAKARQQTGGLYNIVRGGKRYQIIFNTQEGGDHTGHLHTGVKVLR